MKIIDNFKQMLFGKCPPYRDKEGNTVIGELKKINVKLDAIIKPENACKKCDGCVLPNKHKGHHDYGGGPLPRCPFCKSTDLGFAREFRLNKDGTEDYATDCAGAIKYFT